MAKVDFFLYVAQVDDTLRNNADVGFYIAILLLPEIG